MSNLKHQQEQDKLKGLSSGEAVKKIKELADQAKICFFCTESSTGQTKGARPMSILEVDDEGTL